MEKWQKAIALMWIAVLSFIFVDVIVTQVLFKSPTVHVRTVEGEVEVSANQATWQTTDLDVKLGDSWYARFVTEAGAAGEVTLLWQLKNATDETDINGANVTTVFTLSGGADTIYATPDGLSAGNTDWGAHCSESGDYIVTVQP
jgi:hypothetical protein